MRLYPPSDEPEHPFPTIWRPDGDAVPVVVSIPHAGTIFPDEERGHYRLDPEELLRDGDLYTDELFGSAAEVGATVIWSPYNRFVIDLNRMPDDITPAAVEGARRRSGPGYYGVRGLIWAVNTHGDPIYHEPLPREVFERRLTRYYDPYHKALRAELRRLRDEFGIAVLIEGHSMPSRAAALHSDTGKRRADIVPGDLDGQACGIWLSELTIKFWDGIGYSVAMNRPYRGGATTRRYADPDGGFHAIQIELNRRLYMNERSLERNGRFDTTRQACLDFIASVADSTMRRAAA